MASRFLQYWRSYLLNTQGLIQGVLAHIVTYSATTCCAKLCLVILLHNNSIPYVAPVLTSSAKIVTITVILHAKLTDAGSSRPNISNISLVQRWEIKRLNYETCGSPVANICVKDAKQTRH